MDISQAALAEFIDLYKAEFNEDIDPDEALIMARNLIIFYETLMESGVLKPIGTLREDVDSESAAS